tara:strand:- start:518 stop:664 length:147 start_codon:yes stop_codon:yes gene_type:complete
MGNDHPATHQYRITGVHEKQRALSINTFSVEDISQNGHAIVLTPVPLK